MNNPAATAANNTAPTAARDTDDAHLADLRHQVENMDGPARLPSGPDGAPVFDEPWQGRLVATTMETVHHLGLGWEAFRQRLITAIEHRPHRSYYDCWLDAFEDLVAASGAVTEAGLEAQRRTAAAYHTTDGGEGDLEVLPLPVSGTEMAEVVARCGPAVPPGLVVEAAQCRHVELHRHWADRVPQRRTVEFFATGGEPLATIELPNPLVDDDGRFRPAPDWSRLEVWDQLRSRFLGLGPDPTDRVLPAR